MADLAFWKMHGAGNDFILVDDRELTFPCDHRDWIASIARRNFGVGSEGIILIQPSEKSDFRMRFFNPDGGEVEMCGNGARCVARLASEIGAAGTTMQFDTVAGPIGATVTDDIVTLQMTSPEGWLFDQTVDIGGEKITWHAVNTGVPHVVVEVPDAEAIDIIQLGSAIRHHATFAPAGTNANFISPLATDHFRVRTYERGVEAETPACGTGMVAAGLIAGKKGRAQSPVKITCSGGDILEIGFVLTDDGAKQVTLTGPAQHVFQGSVPYPLRD